MTSRPTRATTKALEPAPRVVWTPKEVAQLLAATRDRGVRVAVGLAAGSGLGPGEARHVMRNDLDLQGHRLLAYGPDRSRPPRVMPLCPWQEDLIRSHLSARQRSSAVSPWVLPSPMDPSRPRGDLSRMLQAAQRAATGLDHLPPVTLRTLRRTYQWFAAYGGLPREAVSGSWRLPPNGQVPDWWPRARRLARGSWKQLCGLPTERFPRASTMIMTNDGLIPEALAEARRAVPTTPPPLPTSVWASGQAAHP